MKAKWLTLTLPLLLWAESPNIYYQLNTQEAFTAGISHPLKTADALKKKGNFGIGFLDKQTFFTLYDGNFYKSHDDGSLSLLSGDEGISLAQMSQFHSIKHFDMGAVSSYESLTKTLLPHLDNWNVPYMIVLHGTFNYIKLASLNSQQTPKASEERAIKGSLVGFWMPNSLNHLSLSGFRFHFISQDRKKGGLVLDVAPAQGTCALAPLYVYELEFPQSREFATLKLTP